MTDKLRGYFLASDLRGRLDSNRQRYKEVFPDLATENVQSISERALLQVASSAPNFISLAGMATSLFTGNVTYALVGVAIGEGIRNKARSDLSGVSGYVNQYLDNIVDARKSDSERILDGVK